MQPWQNYLYQQPNQIPYLQQQITYLENQLKNAEAAQQYQQNYPAQQYQPQIQQRNGIYTKVIESFDSITASDIPMDNNGAIFAKQDGSEIQVRRWSPDGKIMTVSYKPVIEPTENENVSVDNSATNVFPTSLSLSDESTKALMDRFNEIDDKIDLLEDMISNINPKQQRTGGRSKKEDME